MMDAWFSPDAARLFSYLSLLSLCSLAAVPAQRGQLRRLVLCAWTILTGLGVTLAVAGMGAAVVGQPSHVTRTLVLSGVIVGVVFVVTRRAVVQAYQDAELRKTVAVDL